MKTTPQTLIDLRQHRLELVAILKAYAPNEDARTQVDRMVIPPDSNDAIRVILRALYEGLTYGNWPWATKEGD